MKPDQPQRPIRVKRLAALHLREDLVLVRPEPPEKDGSIVLPDECREGAPMKYGLRYGVVVACGPGDGILTMLCRNCGRTREVMLSRLERYRGSHVVGYSCICECGELMDVVDGAESRRPLGIKPGDRVLYERSPANEARLEVAGKERMYELLHEEQSVVAVLEAS